MHLKNLPPIFVPERFRAEIEKLSKAALMDMIWDFSETSTAEREPDKIMEEFRTRRDAILAARSTK